MTIEQTIAEAVAAHIIPRIESVEKLIKADANKRMMNKSETAEFLGISTPTLTKWIESEPSFPKPIDGYWARGWIEEWLSNR